FLLFFFICEDLNAALPGSGFEHISENFNPDEYVSLIINLKDRAGIDGLKQKSRGARSDIVRELKTAAEIGQKGVRSFLEERGVRNIASLWIRNSLAVNVRAGLIPELEKHPGIASITPDRSIHVPVSQQAFSGIPAWNIESLKAPELWGLGHTGEGIIIASMDTGVDINHPDLRDRWRGGTNSWFDPTGRYAEPYDADGHGTQIMGIMVGGDAGGVPIGVAPGARWIAAKIFDDSGDARYSDIHKGFQWLLDPDDDPTTNDAPDIVNNSWGLDNLNGCSDEFRADVMALKAAGIAVVFSGGNSGPAPLTGISPADYPESMAVGAVDRSMNIQLFSSRGPSACGNDIYPELVSPGFGIRTSDLSFGGVIPNPYMTVSGTSFAAPHVTGALALLLSAFPSLSLSEAETALKKTALDLGGFGPDNDYGFGFPDVMAAYRHLSNPDQKNCPAVLSEDHRLHIPFIDAMGGHLQAELTYIQGIPHEITFLLTSASDAENPDTADSCLPSVLSSDGETYQLYIPEVRYGEGLYWAEFTVTVTADNQVLLTLTKAGKW
ncbi:MAG: S8 family serine peptidase, partial [Nitrospirae bacterium]|nr:S8 family serine peptidase [Nitrospirota bacterium]